MDRTDARRAAYYNYYSSGTWGMAETYDLCIDSSVLGIDGTTRFRAGIRGTQTGREALSGRIFLLIDCL